MIANKDKVLLDHYKGFCIVIIEKFALTPFEAANNTVSSAATPSTTAKKPEYPAPT